MDRTSELTQPSEKSSERGNLVEQLDRLTFDE